MCLLTFLPAGAHPDLDALHNGVLLNDDGHGFAIVHDGRLLVRHDMNGERLIDAFVAARRTYPDGPALFHSRWSTGGSRIVANCHPYRVAGDRRTVLAHNGVLPDVVQPGRRDRRSDTRIAVEDFIPRLGSLRTRRTRRRLERWMGPANKMVILTVDRRFAQPAYVLNEQRGIWAQGIWYSNGDFRPDLQPPASLNWLDGEDTLLTRCSDCGALVDLADGYCPYCEACFDCGQSTHRCQCWPGAHADLTLRSLTGR